MWIRVNSRPKELKGVKPHLRTKDRKGVIKNGLSKVLPVIFSWDFDETIVTEGWPDINKGKPVKEAILITKFFKSLGHINILWTCRSNQHLFDAIMFCKKHGFAMDYFNENVPFLTNLYDNDSRKIGADYYIDDKNITPWTWKDVVLVGINAYVKRKQQEGDCNWKADLLQKIRENENLFQLVQLEISDLEKEGLI